MNWLLKLTNQDQFLYHGTNNEFNPQNWRSVNDSTNTTTFALVKTTRYGIFLTNNQNFAKEFGSKIIKVKANLQNTAILNKELKSNFVNSIDPYSERELWLLAKYSQHSWGLFENAVGEKFVQWLKNEGYDSATFDETIPINESEVEGTTIVVFNPKLLTIIS